MESEEPQIDNIVIKDFTDGDNSITVYPYNEGYQYSIDGGITYQDSNTFTNLASGVYTIYVKDSGECGIAFKKAVLLAYPKYFSPNADGKSDFWHIKNSYFGEKMAIFGEKMAINIYDRYGKVLASLNQNSPGWDGTYNGKPMPATDYWFVLTKQDGTEHKGHFSLLR